MLSKTTENTRFDDSEKKNSYINLIENNPKDLRNSNKINPRNGTQPSFNPYNSSFF